MLLPHPDQAAFDESAQDTGSHACLAQGYPAKPVRVIVSCPAGGGADIVARALPEVPTVAESGLPGFEVVLWQGRLAPAGTPPAIIERLHEGVAAGMATPDLRERFAQLNVEPVSGTPAQFAAYLQSEFDKWGKVIRAAGGAKLVRVTASSRCRARQAARRVQARNAAQNAWMRRHASSSC